MLIVSKHLWLCLQPGWFLFSPLPRQSPALPQPLRHFYQLRLKPDSKHAAKSVPGCGSPEKGGVDVVAPRPDVVHVLL